MAVLNNRLDSYLTPKYVIHNLVKLNIVIKVNVSNINGEFKAESSRESSFKMANSIKKFAVINRILVLNFGRNGVPTNNTL